LREESDQEAYESLVETYRHADQSNIQLVSAKINPPADRPDHDIDRDVLWDRWVALQDVHDFHAMLQELGVGRVQALRLVGEEFAYKVETNSFRTALEMAAESGLPIMIFAGSAGLIQIHTGPVHKLKEAGPWFNVLDPGFNLHLREDHIATAWVVKKPTRDGIVTALEIYNVDDQQIAWMFGKRKPGEIEDSAWKTVAHALPTLAGPAQ
jgi:putative hemin transport protein